MPGFSRRANIVKGLIYKTIGILLIYLLDVPIPGCRSSERVEENAKGAENKLSTEDVKTIRELSEAADIQGERYGSVAMSVLEGNCIPLEQWKGE